MKRRTARHRGWDLLAYVGIALALIAVIAIVAVHDADAGISRELPLKWLGFAGLTAITFGYGVRDGIRKKAGARFWTVLAAYFVLRAGIWILILTQVEVVPLLVFALLGGPEYMLLLNVLDRFLRPGRQGA